jgi:hypothetical protein
MAALRDGEGEEFTAEIGENAKRGPRDFPIEHGL